MIRDQWVSSKAEIVEIKNSKSGTEMVTHTAVKKGDTSTKGDRKCDVVSTTPYTIESYKKRGWPSLTKERILKAANPSIWKRFDDAAENLSQEFFALFGDNKHPQSAINLIDTWERVIIHEVRITPVQAPIFLY